MTKKKENHAESGESVSSTVIRTKHILHQGLNTRTLSISTGLQLNSKAEGLWLSQALVGSTDKGALSMFEQSE